MATSRYLKFAAFTRYETATEYFKKPDPAMQRALRQLGKPGLVQTFWQMQIEEMLRSARHYGGVKADHVFRDELHDWVHACGLPGHLVGMDLASSATTARLHGAIIERSLQLKSSRSIGMSTALAYGDDHRRYEPLRRIEPPVVLLVPRRG